MFRFPGIIFSTKDFPTYTIQPDMALLITSHILEAIDDKFVIPILSSVVSTGYSRYLRRSVRQHIRDCAFGVAELQDTIHIAEDYVRLHSWWREFARSNLSSQNYVVAVSELNIFAPSAF
jgi:Tfp pilus assembly protein PilE